MSRRSGEENWRNQQETSMFRRGANCASPDEDFMHEIGALLEFASKPENLRLLVVGVAHGEEPLSLLAVLNVIAEIKGTRLQDYVELHTVDTRPRLKSSEIEDTVYKHLLDIFNGNPFIFNSLVPTDNDAIVRINPGIRKYLEKVFDDPRLPVWGTTVQDYIKRSDTLYDAITYNNVHGHIRESAGKKAIIPGLLSKLAVGGLLITDAYYDPDPVVTHQNFTSIDQMYRPIRIYPGIYKRTR